MTEVGVRMDSNPIPWDEILGLFDEDLASEKITHIRHIVDTLPTHIIGLPVRERAFVPSPYDIIINVDDEVAVAPEHSLEYCANRGEPA